MDPKGHHQGQNPPPGFYSPPQPPPAYDVGQPNYQYPPQQQHLVQRKLFFLVYESLDEMYLYHAVTGMDYETSTKTHLMAGLLCAFICWPCAWIPYVVDSCKNANHYCSNCGCFIGTYKS